MILIARIPEMDIARLLHGRISHDRREIGVVCPNEW